MNTILKTYLNDLEGYCNQQQWENIISVCQDLIEHASQQLEAESQSVDADAYFKLGNRLAQLGRIEESITCYEGGDRQQSSTG